MSDNDTCHCYHPYSEHHINAYGMKSVVWCDFTVDRGMGEERCPCTREFAVADIPGPVQPFNTRIVHPRFAEIQDCVAGMMEGLHRWVCHQCLEKGPPEEDGRVCRAQLAKHLVANHGVKPW